ncbi:ABC transporter permease [Paenibacillus sp. SN-8-1]|uniref:ABC transporter permease n=1 Tax=Paenibacillus sp. SN-8-1 TaxID=3435409 RepID=UPI003D9A87F7
MMRLEMKKYKLWGMLKGVVICILAIMALLTLIYFADKTESENTFASYHTIFDIIGSLVRITFVIYASAIIARIIIEEYKNKTINLMFVYPISRKHIMVAKLSIVFLFTLITVLLSNVFLDGMVMLADRAYDIVPETLTMEMLWKQVSSVLLSAVSAAGISLIPLYFGMRRHSVPFTIVSAVLIVSLVSSNTNGFTLSSIIAIPVALCFIGIIIAYMTIRNVDTKDVV